jgi:membrane protease YdiL (CAAX protease family)
VYEPASEVPYLPVSRPVLPLERVGAVVEVIMCSGLPTQVLLIVILRSFGMSMFGEGGRLSPPFVFALSLGDAVLVIGLVVFFLRAHDESVRHVLIGPRSVVREALLGVAVLPAVFMFVIVVLVVILKFVPWLHNVTHNPLEDMLRNRQDALIFAAVVLIAGGVREEVQRGFIVHRFGQYLGGAGWGIAIFSVFFGLGHLEQGFDAALATGLLGVAWGMLYVLRRSIIAPMVSHAGFNLAQIVKYLALAP